MEKKRTPFLGGRRQWLPLAAAMILVSTANGADVVVPSFEVKLLLKQEMILDDRFEPRETVRDAFGLHGTPRKIRMAFLDREKALDDAGWNVRIRVLENSDSLQLTYKRRFPFRQGELHNALERAAKEGFGDQERDYDSQVEWGYRSLTLSLSNTKKLDARLPAMELPAMSQARILATERIPGKLAKLKPEGWARDILSGAHVYGPVDGKRYRGNWRAIPLEFEVWMLRGREGSALEPIVELSFKADREPEAEKARSLLISYLRLQEQWLAEADSLKTAIILERYR